MRSRRGAARAGGWRWLGWVIITLAFLWLPAKTSAAPGDLVVVRSTPAAGSRVGAAPHTVAVEFASAVQAPTLQVFGPDGRRIDLDGTAQVTNGGAAVTVTIENAGRGGYLVAWSARPVGSQDPSAARGGALTFAVGQVPGWTTGPIGGLLTPSGSSGGLAVVIEAADGIALAALVVLVGMMMAGVIRPSPTPWEGAIVVVTAALVLSGTAVVLALHGAFSAGLPAGEALSRSMFRLTLHSDWGSGGLLALAAVAVVGVGTGRRFPAGPASRTTPGPERPRLFAPSRLPALAVVILLCAAAVAEGHAVSGAASGLWASVAAAHVASAAMLTALLVVRFGARAGVAPARATTRFRAVRLLRLAAVLTAVTGLFLAGRETGSVSAVVHTAYGHIVVLKALLAVGVLLAVFAVGDEPSDARTPAHGPPSRFPESAAVLLVVSSLVTGVLVFQTPGRDAVPRPSTGSISAAGVDVEYQLTPARIGANDVHVYVLDATGAPVLSPAASADLRWPAAGAAPLPIDLRQAGPGHFLDYGVEVPFAGTWTLDLSVVLPGGGSRTFANTITVH